MISRKTGLVVAAASMLLLAPALFAASGKWTNEAGGSWPTTGNWSGGTVADGSGFTADFSTLDITADATVNLKANRTIGNLTFGDTNTGTTAGWTLAGGGGDLTLAGAAPTITVNALGTGKSTILSAVIAGTSGFIKSGTGTLMLSGGLSNGLSGAINVNAGTLKSTDGTSFKNMTGPITVASGASFYYGQNFISGNNLTNALFLSGSGTGGNGALNLAYNASSSGPIILSADTTISHDWNNATISGTISGIGKNLTLDCYKTGQGPLTVNGDISIGTGTLTKTGSNSVTLNGTNTYGVAVVDEGVLYFKQAVSMGGSGDNITINANGVAALSAPSLDNLLARVNTSSTGAAAFGGTATTSSSAINLSSHPSLSFGAMANFTYSGTITPGGGNYRLGGGGYTMTVSSALSGANGLIISDAQGGTVVLTGPRTYTGSTFVNSGTLRVDGNLNGTVSIASGGTLAPGPASGIGSLTLDQALTVDGTLGMRIDRADTQKADLLTTPSIALNGNVTVANIGDTLQGGDTFQLFSATGGITTNGATLTLPTLSVGLSWDISRLLVDGTLKVAATSNVIGDPNWPELLPSQLQAVRDAGYTSVTVNPGTYRMPDLFSYQNSFTLTGWSNFTINAENVIITAGPQRFFMLSNCNNVQIKRLTMRRHYPSTTQGRVLSKGTNANGTAYAIWRISDGYPMFATDPTYVPVANEVRAEFAINAVDGATGIINRLAGDTYNCILTPQGNNTWKVDFPGKTTLPFVVNDWLVTRIQDSPPQGIYLSNSTNCTIESVVSQNAGFASFFEQGGGGNKLIGCRVELSPVIPPGATDPQVVSASADGVHCRDAYPGMYIEDFVTTGVLLDDCIAIHGVFVTVTAVSGNTITVDGISKLAVDDPVRISHDVSGYFAQAVCTGITDIGGGNYNVTLDQTLPIPVSSRVANPKYDGDGYKIINCQLSGTRSRAIITKADNGLISGCMIEHSGTAIKLGPEYYWNESGYVWNVTIENNTIANCGMGVDVNADGAIGNKNIIVRDNTFGTMILSYAIRLEGCDGATVSGNNFGVPSAAQIIRLQSSKNITMANNLVAYSASGKNIVSAGSDVTSVQGSVNGMLYSGTAYSLANSLSGLRLVNPASNAAGDPVQQNSQTNETAHWFLHSDGNGHAKIVSAANGLVLGVNNSSTTGSPLILETDGAGDGQLWTLKPVGTSTIELVNQLSGLSATVQTTSPMEVVTQTTGSSASGQLWTPSRNTSIIQNHAPAFTADPFSAANSIEDSPYAASIVGSATDIDDGTSLTYAKVSGPAWLSVASNGAISGTPTNSDVGANSFTVSVSDGIAAAVQATLNITVTNTNDAPAWTSNPVVASGAEEGVVYTGQTLADKATDTDVGDTMGYSKVSGPAWLSVASDGALSGTPPSGSAGLNPFVVRATDTSSATADATLEIAVTGPAASADLLVDYNPSANGTTTNMPVANVQTDGADTWTFRDAGDALGTLVASPAGPQNGTWYGGIKTTWAPASSYNPAFRELYQAGGNSLQLRVQVTGLTDSSIEAVYLWNQADYLVGAGSETALANGSTVYWNFGAYSSTNIDKDLRVVVNQGGTYYISNQSTKDSSDYTFTIDDTWQWAVLNTTDYTWGAFASVTLDDVRGVGVYMKAVMSGESTANNWATAALNDFQVTAFVPQAYATWATENGIGGEPRNGDHDSDGLTNHEEFTNDTDPTLADTDSDGAGDWYEVKASFTDPLNTGDKPNVPYPLPDPDGFHGDTGKPVKVYICGGQSNMAGVGYITGANGSLETITRSEHKFPNLLDAANNWTQRQDVFYKGVITARSQGPLSVGQGNTTGDIGPELGFGHVMGWYHDEPVLVLKASKFDQTLGWDYAPPGTTRFDLDGYTYAAYGESPAKWLASGGAPALADEYAGHRFDELFLAESDMGCPAWTTGTAYPVDCRVINSGGTYVSKSAHTSGPDSEPGVGANWATFWDTYAPENVSDVLQGGVLGSLSGDAASWNGRSYEIAGFVWFQGWADQYDAGYYGRYETNLARLIDTLRATFNAPNAPFVVGTIGQFGGNYSPGGGRDSVYHAQLAVGDPNQHPEYSGTVASVDTTGYWREEAESPGIQSYHYNNNAETYMLIGDALGRAMVSLQTTFAGWIYSQGVAPGLAGFDQDADGDGILNGVEYALGLDPKIPDPSPGVLSGDTITFTKGAEAIVNRDLAWIIETSTTLEPGSWKAEVTQPAGDATPQIGSTFTPGTPARKFARLKAVRAAGP